MIKYDWIRKGVSAMTINYEIASFIYDWAKRRPYRKQTESRVRGLSDKKLLDLLEQERAKETAKKGDKTK